MQMRREVMNKPADTAVAAHLPAQGVTQQPAQGVPQQPAQGVTQQPAYGDEARFYDRRTGAFQSYRRAIVKALPVRPGEVVLDVGCGTGLCCGFLLEKVGPQGGVVGIEESPEMAAMARERIAHEGWRNVTVVQSGAEDAQIAVTADAALFCAVHDILQSPDALRNVLDHLRPGARVAAGGGKWAAPWMVPVNLQARVLHAPFVRSFEGFDRPWNHLEQLIEDVHVREVAFGSGFILTGRRRRPPRSASPAVAGRGRVAPRPHQAGVRSVPPLPDSTDQHASSRALANNCGALMQAP